MCALFRLQTEWAAGEVVGGYQRIATGCPATDSWPIRKNKVAGWLTLDARGPGAAEILESGRLHRTWRRESSVRTPQGPQLRCLQPIASKRSRANYCKTPGHVPEAAARWI